MRAVDDRLKADWINWAENGALTCSAEEAHQKKQHQNASSIDVGNGCVRVGLARISYVAGTSTRQGHAEASLGHRSSERSNSLQRRRRRLRAWCDKVRRPKRSAQTLTNAVVLAIGLFVRHTAVYWKELLSDDVEQGVCLPRFFVLPHGQ